MYPEATRITVYSCKMPPPFPVMCFLHTKSNLLYILSSFFSFSSVLTFTYVPNISECVLNYFYHETKGQS